MALYRISDGNGTDKYIFNDIYKDIVLNEKAIMNSIKYYPMRWPKIVFMKLFIPFFSAEDYPVYMDYDTEIIGDVSELFSMKFDEHVAIANFKGYCNSGVVVFNSKKYKETIDINGLIGWINNFRPMADEIVFKRLFSIKELSSDYNTPPDEVKPSTKIVHHMGRLRKC